MFNNFIEITETDSIVVFYHKGTGQTLVFNQDIKPLVEYLGSSNRVGEPQVARYDKTISTLRKFDMLED